jgi:hypothetical protein
VAIQRGTSLTRATTAGTRMRSARMFENVRARQTTQKASPRKRVTTPASAKDERMGASIAPPAIKADIRGSESNRSGASLSARTATAPRSASEQFVMKSASTSDVGHPKRSSTARWLGSAASRSHHQSRGECISSAARRIAFGGQMADGVAGGIFSRAPMCAPA